MTCYGLERHGAHREVGQLRKGSTCKANPLFPFQKLRDTAFLMQGKGVFQPDESQVAAWRQQEHSAIDSHRETGKVQGVDLNTVKTAPEDVPSWSKGFGGNRRHLNN